MFNGPLDTTDPFGLESSSGFWSDERFYFTSPNQVDTDFMIANSVAYGTIGAGVGDVVGIGVGNETGAGVAAIVGRSTLTGISAGLTGGTVESRVGLTLRGVGGVTIVGLAGGIGGAIEVAKVFWRFLSGTG